MNQKTTQLHPISEVRFISKTQPVKYRYHSYSFIIVLDGRTELVHNDGCCILKTGDVCYINHTPEQPATIYPNSSLLSISLEPEFIAPYLPAYPFQFTVNSA